MTAAGLLMALDLAGVVVFAISGALTASRKELDLVGFMFMASVTGIGGGTLRDLLLARPVFWLDAPHYLLLTCGVAILVYFTAPLIEYRYRALIWADALGLALFSATGADIALMAGHGPVVGVVMGVMTATFGGLIRDVVGVEVPLILKREVYATAAMAGAILCVAAHGLGLGPSTAILLGAALAFAVRAAAIRLDWALPVYRPRPGRDYPRR